MKPTCLVGRVNETDVQKVILSFPLGDYDVAFQINRLVQQCSAITAIAKITLELHRWSPVHNEATTDQLL